MGRRAVSTTKSGRFMNPTDQARKEARRRELKKNKKQRMQVRTSVLKAREPDQILRELDEYDKMELDPMTAGDGAERLAVRVIQEKRRKLLETYERIFSMVKREEPEEASKLLAARQEYEQRRQQRVLYYEQVRATENVDTSSIPLPSLPPGVIQVPGFPPVFPGAIPPPSSVFGPDGGLLPGILKAAAPPPRRQAKPDRPPAGPPPGPPPDLSDCEDEQPPLQKQQKTLRFSEEPGPPGERALAAGIPRFGPPPAVAGAAVAAAAAAAGPKAPMPPLPPIPPLPPTLAPPHLPPSQLQPPPPQPPLLSGAAASAAATSAVPPAATGLRRGQASISAAPQLKNLVGDATKLVPTSLRVRRHPQQQQQQPPQHLPQHQRPPAAIPGGGAVSAAAAAASAAGAGGLVRRAEAPSHRQQQLSSSAKDDAYEKFMQEMQGLL